MRNYLALIVFGLMIAEALSGPPPIDFGEPDFEEEPGFEHDKLTSEDIDGEELLFETREHVLGQNEGEPDYEEEPEGEAERQPPQTVYNEELGVEPEEEVSAGDFEPESVEERDLGQKYLTLMPEDFEGIFIYLLDYKSLKNKKDDFRMLIPFKIYSSRTLRHKCKSKEIIIRRWWR